MVKIRAADPTAWYTICLPTNPYLLRKELQAGRRFAATTYSDGPPRGRRPPRAGGTDESGPLSQRVVFFNPLTPNEPLEGFLPSLPLRSLLP